MKRMVAFAVLAVSALSAFGPAGTLNAGDACCKPVCCAPPPPVEVSWCVEDHAPAASTPLRLACLLVASAKRHVWRVGSLVCWDVKC